MSANENGERTVLSPFVVLRLKSLLPQNVNSSSPTGCVDFVEFPPPVNHCSEPI
jgi:hypothetical protein